MGLKEFLGGLNWRQSDTGWERVLCLSLSLSLSVCVCVCACVCVFSCLYVPGRWTIVCEGLRNRALLFPLYFLFFSQLSILLLPFWTKVPHYLEASPCCPFDIFSSVLERKEKHLFSLLLFLTRSRTPGLSKEVKRWVWIFSTWTERERERERLISLNTSLSATDMHLSTKNTQRLVCFLMSKWRHSFVLILLLLLLLLYFHNFTLLYFYFNRAILYSLQINK